MACWIRATRKSLAEMEEEKGKKYRINTMHLALFQEPVLVPQGSQPFPKVHRAQLVSGCATTSAKLWALKCQDQPSAFRSRDAKLTWTESKMFMPSHKNMAFKSYLEVALQKSSKINSSYQSWPHFRKISVALVNTAESPFFSFLLAMYFTC